MLKMIKVREGKEISLVVVARFSLPNIANMAESKSDIIVYTKIRDSL